MFAMTAIDDAVKEGVAELIVRAQSTKAITID